MWTVYSLDRTSQFVLFPPLDEAHGRWLQWFTLALHPLTVVLWNLNQIPSTPLLISKVQHSNQPMVTGPNLAKTHCWEQLSFLWVIPLMSFHFQGFINQLQWGSSWEQKFAVFEARKLVYRAQLHSDTIALSISTAASLPVVAGRKICFLPARCYLLKRQTHSCYSLLWLHIHMAPSFAYSILSHAAISERLQTLGMSKGFVVLSCPFLFP